MDSPAPDGKMNAPPASAPVTSHTMPVTGEADFDQTIKIKTPGAGMMVFGRYKLTRVLGRGGMGGVTFKPIMMFGMELKDARKIAVVMDVSRSMTRYLPIVAKELDKVAFGSPLVLYFGCGLQKPPRDMDDKVRKAQGDEFARFWQHWQGKASLRMTAEERKKLVYDPNTPMPLEAIYAQMVKRPNTYFIDFNGITYTSPALMCKEVMEADTIYWFADFQDRVDEAHMEEVFKKLKSRKQKLYIHASIRGRSFEQVRDKLVLPLGGEVIETKAE